MKQKMSKINELSGQTMKFAEACYDTNNLEELQAMHTPANADKTDCKEWKITPKEWSEAIEATRIDRLNDYEIKEN